MSLTELRLGLEQKINTIPTINKFLEPINYQYINHKSIINTKKYKL